MRKDARLVLVLAEVVLLGLVRSKSVTSQDGDQYNEVWLEDFNNKDYEIHEMQADTPVGDGGMDSSYEVDGVCPPPPTVDSSSGCQATTCKSDLQCGRYGSDKKCCYNGCVYTCLALISSPSYIDWKVNPRKPFSSGNSWLVSNSQETEDDGQVEPCSTSDIVDDEDALLCPHGFMCHIEELGEPEKGLPNRGRCIREKGQSDIPHRKFRLKTKFHGQDVCVFEKAIFANGASFVFLDHPCECHNSAITCNVSKKKTKKKKISQKS